jgi:hypothetical protein
VLENIPVIEQPVITLPIPPEITIIDPPEIITTTEITSIFDPNIFLYPFFSFPPLELEEDQPILNLHLSPPLVALSLSLVAIALNYALIEAGIHDITQPDQSRSKLITRISNEAQLMFLTEQICQVPHLCFWQGPPLTEIEVKALLYKAYTRAAKRDFTGALKHLDQITPGSPQYRQAQTKIVEYKKKQSARKMILEKTGQVASW